MVKSKEGVGSLFGEGKVNEFQFLVYVLGFDLDHCL